METNKTCKPLWVLLIIYPENVASWSDSEEIFHDLKENLNSLLNLQLHLLAQKDVSAY